MPSAPVIIEVTCPDCARRRLIKVSSRGSVRHNTRRCRPCGLQVGVAKSGKDAERPIVGGPWKGPPPPPEPTDAQPGSPEKLAVMEQRMEAGYAPHHPDDARLTFPARPLEGTRPWRPFESPEAEEVQGQYRREDKNKSRRAVGC